MNYAGPTWAAMTRRAHHGFKDLEHSVTYYAHLRPLVVVTDRH